VYKRQQYGQSKMVLKQASVTAC